jgi:hypothetical protein
MRACQLLVALLVVLLTACRAEQAGQPAATATAVLSPTAAIASAPTQTPAPAPAAVVKASVAAGPSPSPVSPLSALTRAQQAFAQQDYATALQQDRLAFDPRSGLSPELRAFAGYRLVVVDAIVGQEDDARAVQETLRQEAADSTFTRLALVFWDTYGMTGDLKTACGQVTRQVKENPAALEALSVVASSVPGLSADELCVIP